MVLQNISKKRRVAYAVIAIVFVALAGVFFFDFNKGLALEKLPESIKLDDIEWASEERTFFNFAVDSLPEEPIEGLPTDDPVYFTNIHLTNTYQYAQTASKNNWTQSQRLFWRKDSASKWKEIELTEADIYPSNFISENGQHYLAAIGGKISEKNYLYFIDVAQGKLIKQFEANRLLISPDSKKILCDDTDEDYMGFHRFYVLDLGDGSTTHITDIQDSSPGSGTSFRYNWSSDSNFMKFKGTSSKNREGFHYIYEHQNMKLFAI